MQHNDGQVLISPALKLSSIGFRSGEEGGKKTNRHPAIIISLTVSINISQDYTFGFNDFTKSCTFVDGTVIQDKNTSVLRERIHLGQLKSTQ